MTQASEIWKAKFGTLPPTSERLRQFTPDLWVRFHSLPNSKRYPDTEEELGIIASRGEALFKEIFVNETEFLILCSRPIIENIVEITPLPSPTIRTLQLTESWQWTDHNEDPLDQLSWQTYAGARPLSFAQLSKINSWIANEAELDVVISSTNLSNLFIPYDGGFDIFLEDESTLNALKIKFKDWLPSNSLGL